MEPESSLPPITVLSQINPFHSPSYFLKMHFNIIHTSASRSSKWSLFLRFSYQTPACISLLLICHRPHESDSVLTKHTHRGINVLSHVTCNKMLWRKLLLPYSAMKLEAAGFSEMLNFILYFNMLFGFVLLTQAHDKPP